MKIFTLIIFSFVYLFPNLVLASEKISDVKKTNGHYIGGLYYDNLNKVNARFGYSYYLNNEPFKTSTLQTAVLSSELEVGSKGYKITLSHGHISYAAGMGGGLRYGLSYAKIDNDSLAGAEALASVLGVSFKLGVYRNLDKDNSKLMLGLGFGF